MQLKSKWKTKKAKITFKIKAKKRAPVAGCPEKS
jgi:hypothetical protein